MERHLEPIYRIYWFDGEPDNPPMVREVALDAPPGLPTLYDNYWISKDGWNGIAVRLCSTEADRKL